MDASDLIKVRKQKAVYVSLLARFNAKNPQGDCASLSGCCATTTNCNRTFKSFEEKYTFYKGRNACVTGAGPLPDFAYGVEGCLYPVNGGSK